ncbi:MAG: hypothetical protein ACOCY1_04455 [Halovenus sp.]
MPSNGDSGNPDVHATSWLKPEQVEAMRDACLSGRFPTYLQDRNEAAIALLYDAGLRAGDAEDVTPHTLRHSVAYRIVQVEGGRLEDVQLRLRHATLQTTDEVYSHLIPR